MRAMRQRGRGGFGILLAALLLLARLVSPAAAMQQPVDPLELALQTICHADGSGGTPSQPDRAGHHDCLLCPACHLASHAAIKPPLSPSLPVPLEAALGVAGSVPPATGPPTRPRSVAQPTGPPRISA